MPLEDDDIIGHNHDGSFNEDYCKWCYADGTYTYNDMDDLIEVCVKNMVSENFTEEQARSYMKSCFLLWITGRNMMSLVITVSLKNSRKS